MTNCLNFFCAVLAREIGVGRARLGASDARPIGAYIFRIKTTRPNRFDERTKRIPAKLFSRIMCGRYSAELIPNSEVAGGGRLDEAMLECARPRAQQRALFKPRNISQPPAHPTLLRPGRPHSANAEIQLRNSG
jgi:hypothetical protein